MPREVRHIGVAIGLWKSIELKPKECPIWNNRYPILCAYRLLQNNGALRIWQ